MGLTRLPQPQAAHVPVLRPLRLYGIAPVGVMGCIAVGFANSAVWTLAPVYAQAHGLNKGWIVAVHERLHARRRARAVAAGAALRPHGPALSSSPFVCVAAAAHRRRARTFGGAHRWTILPLIGCFGMVALPLYGLSVAHANDRIPRERVRRDLGDAAADQRAGVGAWVRRVAALVMGRFGTQALFFYTAAIHVAMAVFTIVRIAMRDAPALGEPRDRYEPQPQQATPASAELDPRGRRGTPRPDLARAVVFAAGIRAGRIGRRPPAAAAGRLRHRLEVSPFFSARLRARSRLAPARVTARSSSSCEHRPSVTGSTALMLVAFQCERSRIFWIVALVVPISLMMSASANSGWLRRIQ